MSHGPVTGAVDVVAMDGLSLVGTVGFFVPAAALIALVAGAVVRDRRLGAREAAEREARPGSGPGLERITPPRAG